jgi:hypothetical protein
MPLSDRLRAAVHHYLPRAAAWVRAVRVARRTKQVERRLGIDRLTSEVINRIGLRVARGPFEGMAYVSEAAGSMFLPKIVGTYEQEVVPAIEAVISARTARIIDVGAAEGYYAIGLARRLPEAKVWTFDLDPRANRLCGKMAALNGVQDRLIVGRACTHARLNELIVPGTVIVCDCEGYEDELLKPTLVPRLSEASVLVELHDHVVPGVGERTRSRFSTTHDMTCFATRPRESSLDALPHLAFLSESDRALTVNEFRPAPQQWLWLTPKTKV